MQTVDYNFVQFTKLSLSESSRSDKSLTENSEKVPIGASLACLKQGCLDIPGLKPMKMWLDLEQNDGYHVDV